MEDTVIRRTGNLSTLPAPVALRPAASCYGDLQGARYSANAQLIRRRLADENRMTKVKRWWMSR